MRTMASSSRTKPAPTLVPVTLVSAHPLPPINEHESESDTPITPDISDTRHPLKIGLKHAYRRTKLSIALRYKLITTRTNGKLLLFEQRLPAWVRRRLDNRRDTKSRRRWNASNNIGTGWQNYDENPKFIGDGNVLGNDPLNAISNLPTSSINNDPPADNPTPLSKHSPSSSDNDSSIPLTATNLTTTNDGESSSDPIPFLPPPPTFLSTYSAGSFMGAGLSNQPRAPPHAFDEHYRAYSVAMLPRGGDRDNVAYGGKILMPPAALARLTTLNFPSPWMFQLRNPANAAASTHAGVLEFIADDGCVFLPHWMMKTLKIEEGSIIRVTGASLPKGKFVKLQAQETSFVEVSDPKAVLEQALRNFTCLTQGDIIEIIYNTIVFSLLIMETRTTSQSGPASSRASTPSTAPGIAVFDTDLEVDFATPKGWKEPVRPPPKPVETMASKLGLEGRLSASVTPAGSRPGSSLGIAPRPVTPGDGDSSFEAFKGRGETLNGRKTKGKGIRTGGRKIAEVDPHSKIERTDKPKLITSSMLEAASSSSAAGAQPLELEHGQLFFGYPVIPYTPPQTPPNANTGGTSSNTGPTLDTMRGGGNTLSGGPMPGGSTPAPVPDVTITKPSEDHEWGSGGQTLGSARPVSRTSKKTDGEKKKKKKKEVIEID